MAGLTVVYDACVLYPAPLRDLLVRLALTGLFRARWSDRIHDEWVRNLLANRPDLTPARLQRTRDLMDHHVRDSLVSGYEPLIDSLTLPDPDDRHVLAAALQAGAGVIVTYNLRDFPIDCLGPRNVAARHPDDFVFDLLDASPVPVCDAVRRQREDRRERPSIDQLLATFAQQRLPRTVERLRTFAHVL
jgi:predicted nucleic acid-binding protein